MVKEINKILKNFLWGNRSCNNVRSKVAWKEICRPKNEDGLVLKQLGDWNEVLLTQQLWKIIAKKDSLWVKWVNLVKLKGKTFWVIDENVRDRATWKALLELRNKYVTDKDIHDVRINENCCVADVIENNEWVWPEQWVRNFTHLRQLKVPLLDNEKVDTVKWRKRNGQMIEFSVRDV
ncbi:hypothetical protein Tco_0781376 [Tanacetum coccineum]